MHPKERTALGRYIRDSATLHHLVNNSTFSCSTKAHVELRDAVWGSEVQGQRGLAILHAAEAYAEARLRDAISALISDLGYEL